MLPRGARCRQKSPSVSANPPQSSIDPATGVITWNNVGPVSPGQSKNIQVTFRITGGLNSTINNTAGVSNAFFIDGGLVNTDTATATCVITRVAAITGVVWSDVDSSGWDGATGYGTGDFGIPNVAVNLYGCYVGGVLVDEAGAGVNNSCAGAGGTWELVDSTNTNQNGSYIFDYLEPAFYYVAISTTTLPLGAVQSAEANFAANGSGRDCPSTETLYGNAKIGRAHV